MADARDSKSRIRKGVWVRLPPPAPLSRRTETEPSKDLPGFAAAGDDPIVPGRMSRCARTSSAPIGLSATSPTRLALGQRCLS
jgi:hypothetical protein